MARTYLTQNQEAVSLLGKLIKLARKQRKMSEKELAERAGISRATLQKIEKGDMTCIIGLVFEVAALVGVPLFEADTSRLAEHINHTEAKLALLPKYIRSPKMEVDDDF